MNRPLALERVVHRYCGRELGGHVAVGHVHPLPPESERLVQRRSDLSGEDLGRPVPPYLSGYPLPDGRYALARTRYLEDADCLGAVRTETLLLDAAAQAALGEPLAARGAFGPEPDLGGELREYRERRTPAALGAVALAPAPAAPLAARLRPLLALASDARARLLEGLCGPLPLAVVGGDEPLLGALLALSPPGGAWQMAFSGCALSPREWADLALVPPEARDRFALRAARERDLALVDLGAAGAAPLNVGPSPAAVRLLELLERGPLPELEALLGRAARASGGRAGAPAYARPRELGAFLRADELAARPARTPEEQVELANLLRARGAPAAEQVAPFRDLLRTPPLERLPWLLNVLRAGWLPYRRQHSGDAEEPAHVGRVLESALAAGRADLVRAFLEDAGGLYPAVEERLARLALVGLEEGLPSPPSPAGEAQALLALEAARRGPEDAARLARALLRHGPGEAVLLQLLPLVARAEPRARDAARVALLGAAAAGGHVTAVAAALQAFDPRECGEDALGSAWALAARSPLVEPVVLARAAGTLPLRCPLEALLRGARARPEALQAAGGALLRRGDLALPAAVRPLLRLRAVAARGGEPALAAAARSRLVELRRAAEGPLAWVGAATRRVRAGAWGRAAEALAAALGHPAPEEARDLPGRRPTGLLGLPTPSAAPLEDEVARTGALAPGALDDDGEDLARTGALGPGALEDEGERTGSLSPEARQAAVTGPPPPASAPAASALSEALVAALKQLLRAVAECAPPPSADPRVGTLLARIPPPAWELELSLLARLAPLLPAGDPRLTEALRVAARLSLGADPEEAVRVAGTQPTLVGALASALLEPAPPAQGHRAWLRQLRTALAGPGAQALPRAALAEAAAGHLAALGSAPPDPLLLDEALEVARALGHPAAWSALAGLLLAARTPAPALLEDALRGLPATLEPELAARLAARAGEGGLALEALAALSPQALDAVLTALPDGFSLRLQNGLRGLALALAGGSDLQALEALAVVLRHLAPRVAPDRAFRQELARALRERLGGRVAGELARTLTTLAR